MNLTCQGRKDGKPVGLTYCLDKKDHDKHDVDTTDSTQPSVVIEAPAPPDGYYGVPWKAVAVAPDSRAHRYTDGWRTVTFRRGQVVIEPDADAEQLTLSSAELAWVAAFQQWKESL